MPLIPPNFSNSSATPSAKPPWARGSTSNNQQASNQSSSPTPWRKNVKFAPAPSNDPVPVAQVSAPVPQVASGGLEPEQTKTSKLQINLKSVKKPDTPPPSNIHQQQQPAILSQNKVPFAQNPPGKGIPIPIVIQKGDPSSNKPSAPAQHIIPIQRPTANNDPPVITSESKVKLNNPPSEPGNRMPKQTGTAPPAPPPPPGGAPPPPPPIEGCTTKQLKLESIRKAPKKRPDWAGMMKEIERGRVLNHVACNDRSKPILSRMKSRGRFVYESEAKPASKKDALHNRILNEICQGVKLKKVHCNDRSKPILTGLRGLKRQDSHAEGEAPLEGVPIMEVVDDLAYMDVDILRDELQSAKQMLENEVESKHSLERRNRDQKCQIIAMEAEIEALKAKLGLIPEDEMSMLAKGLEKSDSKTLKLLRKSSSNLWKSPSGAGLKKSKSGMAKDGSLQVPQTEEDLVEVGELEEEIVSLKEAVQHSKQQADEMEAKYKEAMNKLLMVQEKFEDSERSRKSLESRLDTVEAQNQGLKPIPPAIQTAERTTQTEEQILEKTTCYSRQQSTADEAHSDDEVESDNEVDEESVIKKKHEREIILWGNKLRSIKDKQHTSRTERKNLKILQKKLEAELKEATKEHKKLQKEVDKMANMLKDVEKELEEDEEEEEEEEEDEEAKEKKHEEEQETEEEEESEEEESESESDDDDEDSDEDDETASHDDRLAVFGKRVKRRENVLMALRKGNYLLRANIDRLKDELEEARITHHDLEHELKAVLEET